MSANWGFIFVARHVADMRRADDIIHGEQWIAGVEHRLFFKDVDGGHAGTAQAQRINERGRRDQRRPAG